MITYNSCDLVSTEDIYKAFGRGFSDYSIVFDMSHEGFVERFFGTEGNIRDVSFIAYDQKNPVGLILSGIRNWDGMKTIRCGTLCIDPDYRGKGIALKLFELHREAAIKHGCKQMVLEVIKSNERAISFYEKLNYVTVSDLKYYSADTSVLKGHSEANYVIKEMDYEGLKAFRNEQDTVHINWQSDVESYGPDDGHVFLSLYSDASQSGVVSMNLGGRIDFLWVDPKNRRKGLGRQLVLEAASRLNISRVRTTVPSNALYEEFLIRLNFKKDDIEQFEMYLSL